LRRNIITCILLGVKQSLERSTKSTFTQKCYSDIHYYNYDDLYSGEDSADGQAQKFQFIDYAPLVFASIRDISNISTESYGASMNPKNILGKLNDQLAKFSDGRSNSFFIFTPDKKFIIKTITSQESQVLRDMLPRLHEYFEVNRHSLINRFYGCHAVRVSHGEFVNVVVLGNVFSQSVPVHESYDIKGSWVNRSAGKRRDPGMDLDLDRKLKLSPMYKELFLRQIQNDALLLCSLGIMDYSLLLGFHFTERSSGGSGSESSTTMASGFEMMQIAEAPAEYYTLDTLPGSHGLMQLSSVDKKEIYCVGIIDVLQVYTRNKQLERFAKVYLLHKDGNGLSAMPPRPYADRFSDKMKKIVM
jgi:1-phosphatidylinositol-4-phosphate 5-kinase